MMPIQLNLIGVDFSLPATAGQKAPGKAAEANGRAAAFPAKGASQGRRGTKVGGDRTPAKPVLTKKPQKHAAGRAADTKETTNRSALLAGSGVAANGRPSKKAFSAVMADTASRHLRAKKGQIATVARGEAAPRPSASSEAVSVTSIFKKQIGIMQATGNLPKVSTSARARQPRPGVVLKGHRIVAGVSTEASSRNPAAANGLAIPRSRVRGQPGAEENKPAEQIGKVADGPAKASVTKGLVAGDEGAAHLAGHNPARPKAASFAEHTAPMDEARPAASQPTAATPGAVGKTPEVTEALYNLEGTRPRPVTGSQRKSPAAAERLGHRPVSAKAVAGEPKGGRPVGDAIRPGLDVHVRFTSADPGSQQAPAAAGLDSQPLHAIRDSQAAQSTAAQNPSSGDPEATTQTIADQVAAQLRANMGRLGQQVVIRLNPPELGRVNLRLLAEGKDLRGELRVSNPETLAQLRLEAPNLFRQLADSGVQVRRLDMSLDDQGLQQQSDWLSRDGERQQQGPGEWSDPQGQESLPEQEPAHSSSGTTPQVVFGSDGSVNLWV